MKKSLLIACFCCLSFGAFAQEEKAVVDQPVSPEMTALQTAANLAKYGYATYSPTSLIEAARIFGTTKVQEGGICDIAAAGLTVTDVRKEILDFSVTYYNASQMIIAAADDTTFDNCKTLEDVEKVLNGFDSSVKVGYQNGTTAQFYVEGDEDWGFAGFAVTGKGYTNGALAVQDLINGNINAVIIDAAPAERIVENFNAK